MTRHELKEQLQHDQFKDSVVRAVDYTATHRDTVIRWAVAAVALLVIVGATVWYMSYRRSQREQDLESAFIVANATVGPATPNQLTKNFPTEEAKRQATIKAFQDVAAKDGDSREGYTALYYAATLQAASDAKQAESSLKKVADSSYEISALAKIALAQLYSGENRNAEAVSVARSLVDHPNGLVSKDQAQVILAQLESSTDPKDAKRILQSLKGPKVDPVVTHAADEVLAQLAK